MIRPGAHGSCLSQKWYSAWMADAAVVCCNRVFLGFTRSVLQSSKEEGIQGRHVLPVDTVVLLQSRGLVLGGDTGVVSRARAARKRDKSRVGHELTD